MTWADRYKEQADKSRASAQHFARLGDESAARHWQNVAETYDDLHEREQKRLEEIGDLLGVRSEQC